MTNFFPVSDVPDAGEGMRAGEPITVPPPAETPNLGLPKPYDDDESWGDDYRTAMDVLDAHPGIRPVELAAEVEEPFDGQMVYESSTARYLGYTTGIGWREAMGSGDGGGGAVAAYQDSSYFGTLAGLAPGATDEVVTLVAPAGWRLVGFAATGNGDGHFRLLVNNAPILAGRIHALERNARVVLGSSRIVTSGTTVVLQVTCEATGAATYEATLIGEVRA